MSEVQAMSRFDALLGPIWEISSPFWLERETARYRAELAAELALALRPVARAAADCPALDPATLPLYLGSARRQARALLCPATSCALLGETGAGKTTLLRQAALWHALDPAAPLPILRNLGGAGAGDPLALLRRQLAQGGHRRLAALLPVLLAEGRVTLLLDDATEADPAALARWLAFVRSLRRARWVLAGRPERAGRLGDLPTAWIPPLSEAAAREALDRCLGPDPRRGAPGWQQVPGWLGLAEQIGAALPRRADLLAAQAASKGERSASEAGPSWAASYRAAEALRGAWRGWDEAAWRRRIAEPAGWREVALLAALAEVGERAEFVGRLLAAGQGGEEGILLALGCAALGGGMAEDVALGALQAKLAGQRFDARWPGAPHLRDVAAPEAAELLTRLLDGPPTQQAQALALLADLGGLHAARRVARHGLVAANDLVSVAARDALQRLGAEGAAALSEIVEGQDAAERAPALELLAQMGAPAVGALIQALHHPEERVAELAAAALAAIGALAASALLEVLREPHPLARLSAISALQQMTDPSAVPFLAKGMSSPSPLARREATIALGRLAGAGAAPYLRAAFRDSEAEVRLAALSAVTDETALLLIPELVRLLRDGEPRVPQAATAALERTGARCVEPLILAFQEDSWDTAGPATRLIQRLEREAILPLTQLLGDLRWRVRAAAAGALRWVRHQDAVEPLALALRDREPRVRVAACAALGLLRHERGLPHLLSALLDRDRRVRRAAGWALGELREARAVEPLLSLLSDRDGDTRAAGVEALSKIGQPAVRPLLQTLARPDWRVRQAAISALKLIADPSTVPALQEAAADADWRVRQAAAEALGEIGDARGVEALVALLGDKQDGPRWAAVEALARVGAPSLAPLLQALGHERWTIRWAAASALGKIGAPALPGLLQALTGRAPEARWAAQSAIAQIGSAAVPQVAELLHSRHADARQVAAETLSQIDTPGARHVLAEHGLSTWQEEERPKRRRR